MKYEISNFYKFEICVKNIKIIRMIFKDFQISLVQC